MDRKDQKGMYTNTFVHFLLAYKLDITKWNKV